MLGKRGVQAFEKVRPDKHTHIYIDTHTHIYPVWYWLIPNAKANTHHTPEHTNGEIWKHADEPSLNKSLNGKIIGYQLLGHKSIEILVKMSCIIVFM
jgi:hypothetical protein